MGAAEGAALSLACWLRADSLRRRLRSRLRSRLRRLAALSKFRVARVALEFIIARSCFCFSLSPFAFRLLPSAFAFAAGAPLLCLRAAAR